MIRRNIEAVLRRALADTPVVLLNGARQTGKTTLARSLAEERGAEYHTLDDAATLALATVDPVGFVSRLPGQVVIDEIQRAPTLFPALKLAVDRERTPGRFLLTGSANVLTLPRLAESLAGRMEIISLRPFSAGELTGRSEGFLARLFGGSFGAVRGPESVDEVVSRLVCGGFPESVARKADDRRAAWFGSYVTAILHRDVRDLARIEALHSLPNLLRLLAARGAGILNLADVGRDAALPHATLTRYLALLETVFQVERLPAWSPNLGQRLVKAPKIHLVDTGLAAHLLGADSARLLGDRLLLGKLVESFVVGELRKQISWAEPRTTPHHFRTAAGSEVDVVLERPDGSIAAIEVKATSTIGASDFAALGRLRDGLKERFRAGVVLYLGDRVLPSGDRLWLVPVSALWKA